MGLLIVGISVLFLDTVSSGLWAGMILIGAGLIITMQDYHFTLAKQRLYDSREERK